MKIKVRQSSINSYYDYVYMEKGLENINKTIDLFSRLIKNDNISFDEYIDIINRLYNVQFTNNDLIRISSIILGDISKSVILNTNMVYDVVKYSEITNYFEYFEEEHKLYLKVAYVDDKDISFNRSYTSTVIKKMILDNKIVLLDFVLNEEDDLDFYEVDEINGLYPISNIINNFTSLKDINEDYIPSIITYLKSYFNIDRLKKDLNYYIHITKIKLQVLEKYIKKIQNKRFTRVKKFDDILIEVRKIKERKISKEI